jgi:hypothetical protein
VPEDAREKSLADAGGAQEDDVFVALDEVEAEEVADPIAIESDRRVSIEALEGLLFLEADAFEAVRKIGVIAPIDIALEDELQEVELTELRLLGVGEAIGERWEEARELLTDFHER